MLEDRPCLVSRDYSTTREPDWAHITYPNKRPPDDEPNQEEAPARKSPKPDRLDSSSLIPAIGRDNSINCLLRCSRADYCSLSSLNTSFRNLIRSGELYRLRRLHGVIEHWIYFSCQLLEWEAFDPTRRRWLRLPRMDPNDCFPYADKESLAVGTNLLVFGRDLTSHAVYRYSLLTNEWSPGTSMLQPRCLFGSASLGSSAIVAGGCDSSGNVLRSVEIYDSETGFWRRLPDMNRARKMCSGVFMDGKFYVVGGVGMGSEILTCAEEYDPVTGVWRELPEMSPVRAHDEMLPVPVTSEAPPLVAVVGDELYAADYAAMEVRRYDKRRGVWGTVGGLPRGADSMFGWGLAFRACGEKLIVVGGPRNGSGDGFIEVNAWVPGEGPAQWEVLGRRRSGSFVYNCAVMGC